MIGDKLLIKEYHTKIAKKIFKEIKNELLDVLSKGKKYAISVAGESGAGKSEIGNELKKVLLNNNFETKILAQDDYFVFPPKTNHKMRINNIDQVGLYEVKMDLIESNVFDFKNNVSKIYKPIINYDEDNLFHEILDINDCKVMIIEGTYTTTLNFIDKRIFINSTYIETKINRFERGRDKMDDIIENILKIEHEIIKKHKDKSDIVIDSDFSKISIQ